MAGVIWQNDQAPKMDFSSIFSAMVDVSDIPERLRLVGRNQAALARHLRMDPSTLTKMIKGGRRLKADEMVAMEAFFEAAEASGARNAGAPATKEPLNKKLPMYGYASTGNREGVRVDGSGVVDWIDPPPFWSGAGELIAIRVVGVAMEPRLFEGETVFAQLDLPPARDRDCVIELKDGTGLVRTYSGRDRTSIVCREWHPEKVLKIPFEEVKAVHAIIWRR